MFARHIFNKVLTQQIAVTNILPSRSAFESSVNLKKIYPNSTLNIAKESEIPLSSADSPFTGYIPIDELTITYSKSSGPGGQNVNKVNTKVDLRFHLKTAKWLPSLEKSKMEELYRTCINSEGYFIIKSERTRSQQLNLADAIDKLRYMIYRAVHTRPPPSYKDLEMQQRRMEKASRERLRLKREQSLIKQNRQIQVDLDGC